jgi:alcohol dehydrogenase class IV
MSNKVELRTAGQIHFGNGAAADLPALVGPLGERALVVLGRGGERHAGLLGALAEAGVVCTRFAVPGEPTTEVAVRGVAEAVAASAQVVVAIGGGSVIDTGKAIAALVANGGDPLDYLEVVGKGRALTRPSLPVVAVPTTAGTGAEVTRNAVLTATEHKVKVSLRSPFLLPTIALVDPLLAHGVPPAVTASTGLDALTQVIEPFVCARPNPLVDPYCREGIFRGVRALELAFEHGDDADARRDLALTSLFGGIALANAKLGAVHGFAGPLGGAFGAPHGALCARLLAPVWRANVKALRARAPGHPALGRYLEVAFLLTGKVDASAEDGIARIEELTTRLGIPRLSAWGVREEHFQELATRSAKASSMQGNPVTLTPEELVSILAAAL